MQNEYDSAANWTGLGLDHELYTEAAPNTTDQSASDLDRLYFVRFPRMKRQKLRIFKYNTLFLKNT